MVLVRKDKSCLFEGFIIKELVGGDLIGSNLMWLLKGLIITESVRGHLTGSTLIWLLEGCIITESLVGYRIAPIRTPVFCCLLASFSS